MTIIEGIVLIVLIIGVFVFLSLIVVMSDREGTYYPDTPKSHYPSPTMWTTLTTYGPTCPRAEVDDGRQVKLCTLEPMHSGECQYKIIELGGSEKNDEKLS